MFPYSVACTIPFCHDKQLVTTWHMHMPSNQTMLDKTDTVNNIWDLHRVLTSAGMPGSLHYMMYCEPNKAKQSNAKPSRSQQKHGKATHGKAKHGDSMQMRQVASAVRHVVQGADSQQSAGTE